MWEHKNFSSSWAVPICFTSLFECRSQREEIGSEEAKASVLHMISYDRDQPAAWELQIITKIRKNILFKAQEQKEHNSVCVSGPLLDAGDVERHSSQHHLGAHALHRCSHSQVQLTAVGELRSGAQVRQGLQRLLQTPNRLG